MISFKVYTSSTPNSMPINYNAGTSHIEGNFNDIDREIKSGKIKLDNGYFLVKEKNKDRLFKIRYQQSTSGAYIPHFLEYNKKINEILLNIGGEIEFIN